MNILCDSDFSKAKESLDHSNFVEVLFVGRLMGLERNLNASVCWQPHHCLFLHGQHAAER